MKLRAAILVVWCLWPPLMAGAAEHLVETISSRGFQAIQVASQELERHNLHVADYRITVWHEGASVFVLFGDPNADPGQRGCCSDNKLVGFEVELRRNDLTLVRSHFSR
jgi:hypothetical protein